MAFKDVLNQYLPLDFTALRKLLGASRTTSGTQDSAAEYQPLSTDTVAPENEIELVTEAETLQDPEAEMGFNDSFEKAEGRPGDAIAQVLAIVSAGTFFVATWVMTFNSTANFKYFGWHPILQTLGLVLFTYGILTLQPTSQARTKAAGLTRHQIAMIVLGIPVLLFGYTAIFVTKNMTRRRHFTTWHGVFGLWALGAMSLQVLLGGGSVWFNGIAFGGNPRAKSVWKYHRVVGYVTFFLLLLTLHLGGAWSTWSGHSSSFITRLFAFWLAPAGLAAAVYARVRLSKMQFF